MNTNQQHLIRVHLCPFVFIRGLREPLLKQPQMDANERESTASHSCPFVFIRGLKTSSETTAEWTLMNGHQQHLIRAHSRLFAVLKDFHHHPSCDFVG
jgi:hypothetical protein